MIPNHQYDQYEKGFHTENDDTPLAYLALELCPSSFSTSKRLENTLRTNHGSMTWDFDAFSWSTWGVLPYF